MKTTSDPPLQARGDRLTSLAVPTTTYQSVSGRDENVHTAKLTHIHTAKLTHIHTAKLTHIHTTRTYTLPN